MDITLIYFIYGLAFFSMGLAMLFESGRSPLLAETAVLRPLAIFGLVHGLHEWVEMFLDKSDWLSVANPVWLGWLRIGLLSVSFVSLLVFGILMIRPMGLLQRETNGKPVTGGPYYRNLVLAVYMLAIFAFGFVRSSHHVDYLTHLDASVRYALAVPGATISGLALLRQSRQGKVWGYISLSRGLGLAGMGFLFYAGTQLIIPPLDTVPGECD